jgi:uncharacterized protein YwgA
MVGNREILHGKTLVELVLDVSGGVDGRKKLQKIIYLANNLGWNAFSDFRFHLYGPYSEGLLTEVQDLESAGFVEVEKTTIYGDTQFYLHRITERGRELLNELRNYRHDEELVRRTSELVQELKKYSADELELMASLYYLKRQNPELQDDQLVANLRKLKPHFSEDAIGNAMLIFDIMPRL